MVSDDDTGEFGPAKIKYLKIYSPGIKFVIIGLRIFISEIIAVLGPLTWDQVAKPTDGAFPASEVEVWTQSKTESEPAFAWVGDRETVIFISSDATLQPDSTCPSDSLSILKVYTPAPEFKSNLKGDSPVFLRETRPDVFGAEIIS